MPAPDLSPEPQPESAAFWEGLRRGKLVLQRCAACGKVRHYPRPMCDASHSMHTEAFEASGGGALHSWTVAHRAFHPAFEARVPYILGIVDLDEGVRMNAPLLHVRADALRVGMRLQVTFEDADSNFGLPSFMPAER